MLKSAKFISSHSDISQTKNLPPYSQVAFVGRSNVGKSSLINMLTNQKNLAVTSKTPGRTRLINFFECRIDADKNFYLVDLPGYGFAMASKSTQYGWGTNITQYLTQSKHLNLVFVLLDVRHTPTKLDMAMIHFLQSNNIPFSIIATKCDKLSRAQQGKAIIDLANALAVGRDNIIPTSSKDKNGRDEILAKITTRV
ncbi:MAG: ribosome biogenesis GTP-binding protein YihA/YsxC [Firmicutes bacterium]|nr:ribosome biogenesis GTP-binding protein YihA/YsxC [Bacillota bacterium]